MQKFKFPMEFLRITQGENDGYSHAGSLAMDFGGKDTGSDKLYCPCDMIVKRCRHNANGELYLESTLPVEFADGTTDYARLICIHDNTFNVVEGQVLKQGDYFYDEGGMGAGKAGAFGTHVHIEAGKGKWKSCTQSPNAQGTYVIENQSHLYDLFIIGDDVEILADGGYKWKRVSDLEGDKTQKKIYGVDVSHNRSKDIMQKIVANKKAEFVIFRSAVGSDSVDKHLDQYIQDSGDLKVGFFPANYFGSVQDAIEEADYTINTIEERGFTPDKLSLPVFCDWEGFSYDYQAKQGNIISPEKLREMTEAFCERVKSRGYKTGVYLNKNYWDNWYGQAFFDEHPDYYIWYARPGLNKPDKDCYIWQYDCSYGSEYGVSEPLDKNILMGDYIKNDEKIWVDTDKYFEVTGSNCEYFSDTDVNTPIGYLPKGTIYKIKKLSEKPIADFIWAEIVLANEETAFVVVLDDRCTLIDEPNLYEGKIKELKEKVAELAADNDYLRERLDENIACLKMFEDKICALENKISRVTADRNNALVERDYYKEKSEKLEEYLAKGKERTSALISILESFLDWLKGV